MIRTLIALYILVSTLATPAFGVAQEAPTPPLNDATDPRPDSTTASSAESAAPDRLCPCEGPASGGSWRSHGAYVSCIAHALRGVLQVDAIERDQARDVFRQAVRASCGVRSRTRANARVCGAGIVLPCATVQTAHADSCEECTAALDGRLVTCVRIEQLRGAVRTACAARPPWAGRGSRIVELRTGVDCNSCEAKLGSEAPEGVTCLDAACPAF